MVYSGSYQAVGMRTVIGALLTATAVMAAGCSGDGATPEGAGATGGANATGEGGGSGGGGAAPNVVDHALLDCSDRTVIVDDYLAHDLATDSTAYYWLGFGDEGIAVLKKPKSGGERTIVTQFPGYFSFILGDTELPVSGDSQFYMDDTVADDADDYVYFSGDTQIWRVKKDGSEPVQPVSGTALNELGPATCNFARSVLSPDALYTCRQGRLFRMSRAGNGSATAVYSAPAGDSIDAFTVTPTQVFVNGAYDAARHFSPILALPSEGGTPTEYGAMLEGLNPDALFMHGTTLVFDSLFVPAAPDLATESEWAERQGTYKLTAASAQPQKLSDDNLMLVRGVAQDANYLYGVVGDQKIIRISLDGTTTTYVDCHDSADDVRFQELLVDDDGVYVRSDDTFYRFGK